MAAAKRIVHGSVSTESLEREIAIMRKLQRHPNIVAFTDLVVEPHVTYIVMELAHRGDLFELVTCAGKLQESRGNRVELA